MSRIPKTDPITVPMPKYLESLALVPLPWLERSFRFCWLCTSLEVFKPNGMHRLRVGWPQEFENMIRDGDMSAKEARRSMLIDSIRDCFISLIAWISALALLLTFGLSYFIKLWRA